jgi:receptor protein-tyrosine kinase
MVTSALEGEGKTFISSNLAASIALGFDEYVLLVDTDFHKTHLNRHFNVGKVKGLSDYLCGDEPDLGKLIRSTGIPKLSALFAGTQLENAVYKLSSDLMQKLIAHMKTRYTDRYIIFDTTPAQLPETIALSSVVDGVVIVIDPKKSDKQVIQNTLELIDKEKILGIILNRYKRNKQELYAYQYYR